MIEMKTKFLIMEEPKKQGNCKYKAACSLYSESSFTCTHTGGSYCGKYRKLSGKPTTEDYIQTLTA
jgi:hypothetical protein